MKIKIYNYGQHSRDFTYIDDVVDGITSVIKKPSKNKIPFNIFNIGNGNPKRLLDYLKQIEDKLNKKAKIDSLPLQIGDIKKTHSNISSLKKYTKYKPKTNIKLGIGKFIDWYKYYYKIK